MSVVVTVTNDEGNPLDTPATVSVPPEEDGEEPTEIAEVRSIDPKSELVLLEAGARVESQSFQATLERNV